MKSDWEEIKEKILPRIKPVSDMQMDTTPHRKIEGTDLAVTYVLLDEKEGRIYTLQNSFLEDIGLEEEDFYRAAMKNQESMGSGVDEVVLGLRRIELVKVETERCEIGKHYELTNEQNSLGQRL